MANAHRGRSTSGIGCLCDDLIVDILSRLTTSDLHRCDLVCKAWHLNIIPSILSRRPKLALIQDQIHHTPRLLCFPPSLNPRLTTDMNPKPSLLDAAAQFDLLLTCNGMTLSRCINHYHGTEIIVRLVVQNPITGNLHWLASPDSSSGTISMLVFDPRTSIHEFKITTSKYVVYSSTTGEWKPMKAGPPCIMKYMVYSSTTGEWKPMKAGPPSIMEIKSVNLAEKLKDVYCLNGFAYKVTNYSDNLMLEFNVENEKLEFVLLPSLGINQRVKHCFKFLGESAGCLLYGYYDRDCLWTWVYEVLRGGYRRMWLARYKVSLGREAAGSVASPLPYGWTLFFHPGELDVVLLVFNGTLHLIRLSTAGIREVGKLPESSGFHRHLIFPFLLPPNVQPSSPVHKLD